MTATTKHAYLIMAHNEPRLLEHLISCLDHERNDIYIHIDRKANFDGCMLSAVQSRLYVLPERLDGHWGDFSLVEIELLLFKEAHARGKYAYYHLLSGVDMPIKSQDEIHAYCDQHSGTEFIGFADAPKQELHWRSQHYFLFPGEFQSANLGKRLLRTVFARLQSCVGYRRCRLKVKKGAQWCSVTEAFVVYLLEKEEQIRSDFSHTYCPDELYIQTLCWNSRFKNAIFDKENEFLSCKRFIKWVDGSLLPLTEDDLGTMLNSPCWFARKFSNSNWRLVKALKKELNEREPILCH